MEFSCAAAFSRTQAHRQSIQEAIAIVEVKQGGVYKKNLKCYKQASLIKIIAAGVATIRQRLQIDFSRIMSWKI